MVDGTFDDLKTVVPNFRDVHGIAHHDGYLCLSSSKELKRGKLTPDRMVQPEKEQTIICYSPFTNRSFCAKGEQIS